MIWEVNSTHSCVSFAVRVLSVTMTKGHFNSLRGRLYIDEVNPGNSWVEAEVAAASIDTGNRLRDAHLRSSGFFAVKRYPTIAFQSTSVGRNSNSTYSLVGNLTLRGVTKPVVFAIERGAPVGGPSTSRPYILTARGTINRRDFGLGQSLLVRFAASRAVDIEIAMVAAQQAMEPGEAQVAAE
jgi:polyisoprenoid-binding protein YceI